MTQHNAQLMFTALNEYWKHCADMAFIKDIHGAYIGCSQPFAEMTGHSRPDELIGKTDFEIFADQELARRYVDDDVRLLAGDVSLENYVEPITTKDGRPRYCLTSKYILRDDDGNATGIFGVSRDITHEYEAQKNYEDALQNFFDLPQDALIAVLFDVNSWHIVDTRHREGAGLAFAHYITVDEYFKHAVAAVVEDESAREFFRNISQAYLQAQYAAGKRDYAMQYLRRMPDGSERWVHFDLRFLLDPVNGNLSMIILLRDVDDAVRAYSELLHAAERDPMTDLLNRKAMLKQIEHFLGHEGAGGTHALFMIDLDDFKQINDNFGHQYGDMVLKDAARAIKNVFRSTDIVARLGGDEFMALMKDVDSEQTVRRKAEALIAELQFSAHGHDKEVALELTSSVGVTLFRAGERSFDALYQEVDVALYQAKENGKNCFCRFDRQQVGCHEQEVLSPENVDTVHLRTLLEYMDGGVIMAEVTDDIRITYVSPSLFRSFGRTEIRIGRTSEQAMSIVYPPDLPGLREVLFRTAHNHELANYSYRVVNNDRLEWRHIRAKRLPENEDGIPRLISVITDVSSLKSTEENLRETEVRYRTAVEQTDITLWEVDLASRTLTLLGAAWADRGYDRTVFPDAPESFLANGRILPDSLPEFRRMFEDMYNGEDSRNYYLHVDHQPDREGWVRAHFHLLRGEMGTPYCALGVTVPVPHINAEMRRFEQEIRFAEIVKHALQGYICANFTQNTLEHISMNADSRYDRFSGLDYDSGHRIVCRELVYAEDSAHFERQTAREYLLGRFHEGENWRFVDYRRIEPDGSLCWTSLFIKLMPHPISGEVYAFGYLRNNEARRHWEQAEGMPLQRNATLLLYSPESMEALARHIITSGDGDKLIAVSVIELLGLEQIRNEIGTVEAGELLLTFGRLCRIAVGGDVVIGQLDENRIALLRSDAGSADRQYERVSTAMALLKKLLAQAHPEAHINLVGGFAVEKANRTTYELLVKKAVLACRSASQTLDESAVAYADTGMDAPNETDVFDLIESYRALELRYQQQANMLRVSENDELTGLLSKQAFYRRVREQLNSDPQTAYMLIRFDVNRFKVYNDVRGTLAGDQLLRDIAIQLRQNDLSTALCARLESDHFVMLTPDAPAVVEQLEKQLASWLGSYSSDFRLSGTIGVFRVSDPSIDVSLMCDRALLAMRAAKSGFETKCVYYDETLRDRLLEEQELMDDIETALQEEEFELYYQPQVNYEDGTLIGAEALVRWNHPERGLLSPAIFIPLFEKNGLITRLDHYVWDHCCRQIRCWRDRFPDSELLPISVNVSRMDIYAPKLCRMLLDIVRKYDLPVSALKLEITESAYMENPQQLVDTVRELQEAGFTVQMDDFGSGYSSLNTLKDVAVDVLKLDMKFLATCADSARGGNILSSIIRMAHWLKLPVIAEGVETRDQADYLKSLGCLYMQGYHFARPMPAAEFERLLTEKTIGDTARYNHVDLEGVAAFWDPSAQTALLFNSFIGGAAIVEYENGNLSIVRANSNFYTEIETTRTDYLDKQQHTLERFDDKNKALYTAMLEEAIRRNDEAECELLSLPQYEGGRRFWTHNRVRPLAKNGNAHLLYLAVENITTRKELEEERNAENERNHLNCTPKVRQYGILRLTLGVH